MDEPLTFETEFDARAGACLRLSPLVRRVVAGNRGPMTFTGTCTYLVGETDIAVIDPGPEDAAQMQAILAAVGDARISAILVTHTHRDHSPGARPLAAATGAPIIGCGPHRPSRPLRTGEANRMEGAGDQEHMPERELADGESITGNGWTLEAVATPGHTANHLAFALHEEKALFSGDHVMAWSTSFVGPPDGNMTAYMQSLEKLRRRDDEIYWPGHGGPVREPARFLRALIAHRRQRETMILARVTAGDSAIPEIVTNVYPGLAPALVGAASLNVLAHLEDLVARGQVRVEGALDLDARFHAA
ncbi:MAG: MBL fold metallo-hydrolase [Salinarimonas sp.]|nr:MBL fold metallo-hydrolase [Salinarimonas sp.]